MKITYQEFKERQNWNLYQKIDHAVGTMERFLSETNGRAFISFSGGKDSTVLLDIARRFIDRKFLGVFSNTGNEYPETVKFVRSFDNLTIIHPQMRVKEVLAKYGFPLISKEQSQYIRQARNTKSEKLRDIRLNGKPIKSGKGGIGGKISEKWKFVIQAPFEVSEMCCYKLKKEPFELYHKQTGLNPIIGTTAEESRLRLQKYLKTGCNNFDGSIYQYSKYLSKTILLFIGVSDTMLNVGIIVLDTQQQVYKKDTTLPLTLIEPSYWRLHLSTMVHDVVAAVFDEMTGLGFNPKK